MVTSRSKHILLAGSVLALSVGAAQAQSSMAAATTGGPALYVSPTTGKNTGVCPIKTPCATLGYAISKALPSSQIYVVAPGDISEPTTINITKSVQIIGDPNGNRVVAPPNAAAFTINAAAGDKITMKRFAVVGIPYGAAAPGTNGIVFNSGNALRLEHMTFGGFGQAASDGYSVKFVPGSFASLSKLEVFDSVSDGVKGAHFYILGGAAGVNAVFLNSHMVNSSGDAIIADSGGAGATRVSLDHVEIANTTNTSVHAQNGARVTVNHSLVRSSATAILADSAPVILNDATVTFNTTGVNAAGTGTVYSLGNNNISFNTTGLAVALSPISPQ